MDHTNCLQVAIKTLQFNSADRVKNSSSYPVLVAQEKAMRLLDWCFSCSIVRLLASFFGEWSIDLGVVHENNPLRLQQTSLVKERNSEETEMFAAESWTLKLLVVSRD